MITNQPIKRHGGKCYLAKQIVALMPPRCKNPNAPAPDDPGWLHFVEPYFGGGAVLLAQDPEGISEVVNDIDGELTNFWQVLQNADTWRDFCRIIQAVPPSKVEFTEAKQVKVFGSDVDRAVNFFIINRQSRQALGKDFATLVRNRTRRGMNELASSWLSAIDGLPEVYARLQRVVILNNDAVDVIRQQDGPRTLFYLDPPYLHETRTVTDAYEHEMTEQDHANLLNSLVGKQHSGGRLEGRFLLSGYHSDLYDSYAERFGWKCHEFQIDNKASGGKNKRTMTECVWRNY